MLTSLVAYMRRHGLLPPAPPQPAARIPVPSRLAAAPIRVPAQARRRAEIDNRREWVPEGLTAMGRTSPDRHQGGQRPKEGVEPAMEGIPRDAFQRMPPAAASPGLPPVDPVDPLIAELADGVAPIVPDKVAASRERGAATDSGGRGQGISGSESCQNVAFPPWDNPCANPSRAQSGILAPELSLRGTASKSGEAERHVGWADAERNSSASAETYGAPRLSAAKEHLPDPWHASSAPDTDEAFDATEPAEPPPVPLDSRSKDGSLCAGEPMPPRRRLPPRIAERPRVEEWTDDELLTLPEAAALFWPTGPITTNTLRTAGRDGALAITKVAGKFFTTPMAIRRMGHDEADVAPGQEAAKPVANSPRDLFEARLEEARRQGRDRKRRQRAAKRSVVSLDKGAGR
ncbi:hypothetical protein [Methylobacterium sp. D54C]